MLQYPLGRCNILGYEREIDSTRLSDFLRGFRRFCHYFFAHSSALLIVTYRALQLAANFYLDRGAIKRRGKRRSLQTILLILVNSKLWFSWNQNLGGDASKMGSKRTNRSLTLERIKRPRSAPSSPPWRWKEYPQFTRLCLEALRSLTASFDSLRSKRNYVAWTRRNCMELSSRVVVVERTSL